jgi:hypothetical protein
LRGVREILTMAADEQVDLGALVSRWPYEFAVLFATCAGLGSVVTATARFAYLRSRYGIDVDQHLPHVREDELRFMVLRADLDAGSASVQDVWWQLSNMSYRTALVAVVDRRESAGANSTRAGTHLP